MATKKKTKTPPRAVAAVDPADPAAVEAAETAAHATGNMALVRKLRAELGVSSPPDHAGRDAITRTSRKERRK